VRIGSVHTLYGRRAGAELLAEKTILGIVENYPDMTFIVYCNREALAVIPDVPRVEKRYVPLLNNQFTKILWLQFNSSYAINNDCVDVFWIPSGCNSFPGRWKIPSVVTFLDFGEYHVKQKYDFKRILYRKLLCIPASIKRGSAFVSISISTARDLQRLFSKKSQVIYPGASPRPSSQFISDPSEIVLSETGFDYNRLILVPGRTDFYGKGLDVLLQAYQKLMLHSETHPPLVLVGPAGEQHELLLLEIQKLGLDNKVRWLGRVSDKCLDALYQLSSFVVFPSRFEGFGFPLLEAMQHSKPIICSDAGSLPEIAGSAALVFHSGDSSALAENMERMVCELGLAEKLISSGLKRVEAFNWQQTYSKMYQLFGSLKDSQYTKF